VLVVAGVSLFAYAFMQPATDVGAMVWGFVANVGLGISAIGGVVVVLAAWWAKRCRRD
jgi:hypothetical protein